MSWGGYMDCNVKGAHLWWEEVALGTSESGWRIGFVFSNSQTIPRSLELEAALEEKRGEEGEGEGGEGERKKRKI